MQLFQFPDIANNIYGEENNSFSNALGETITVSIQSTVEETAGLLSKVLDDGSSSNSRAAQILANEIHRDMTSDVIGDQRLQDIPTDLLFPYDDIGIWIDPIGMHDRH